MQHKFKSEEIIMAIKQIQNAGDNAQQLQANNMVINIGIDEKRAREIYEEMNLQLKRNYTEEALKIANLRVAEFENRLMPKMESVEGALGAFADPGFQLLLVEAQKSAAATERPADYDLLSELLIHRFQKGNNRISRAGIRRAVEIVGEISDEALLALTVSHGITHFIPISGNIYQGLNVLNDLFGKILYSKLPKSSEWLDHLDILDAVRINSFGNLKTIQQYYAEVLHGYIDVGIEKNSENYNKAIEIMNNNGIPHNLLVENVINDCFYTICLVNKEQLDSILIEKRVLQNNQESLISSPLSEAQKIAIYQIYELYKTDDSVKNENIKKFMEAWDNRPNLKSIRDWWDNIGTSFQLTSVGKVLAHSNAQRCDNSLPPLN